jgi:multiple sugar transport system substrate-binding protein
MKATKERALRPGRPSINRRDFLKQAIGLASLSVVGAACAAPTPAAAPPAVTKEVEKVVVTQEVEKVVEKVVTKEVEKVVTAQPAAKEAVVLRLASVGWGGSLSEPFTMIIKDFNAATPGVSVSGYEDLDQYSKIMAQAAGNIAADVYLFENKFMTGFAARGFFLPLEELVAGSQIIKKADFFEGDWNGGFWRKHQYVIPFDNSPSALYYNPDLFDAAGVAYPPAKPGDWDWAAFLDAAKKLTKGEGAAKQFGWMSAGVRFMHLWLWNNGGSFLNDTLNKCIVDSPEAIEAVQWCTDLITKYNVAPFDAQVPQDMGRVAMFLAKRVAVFESGPFDSVTLKQQQEVKWQVAPHPKGKAGLWVRNPLDSWGLWLGTAHRAEGFKFIEFLCTDDSVKKLTSSGFTPSKKKFLYSDAFLKQEPQSVNWQVFIDLLENHTHQMPDTPIYSGQEASFQTHWDAILAGNETAEKAMKAVAAEVNALFDECRADGYCD